MKWFIGALLGLAPTAYGITDNQAGINIGLSGSIDMGSSNRPVEFTAAPGVEIPITFWHGKYDPSFALGRYWGVGVAPRVHWHADGVRFGVPLHIERGTDLIALSLRFHGDVGPTWAFRNSGSSIGAMARVGATVKYRRNKNMGPTLTLQLGGDYMNNEFNPRGEILLGFDFAFRINPPSSVEH